MTRELELVFKHAGGVELRELDDDETVVWASDSDNDFRDKFPNEFLDVDDDTESIQDFLIDQGTITQEEAEDMEINEEYLGGPGDDDDDDDGDTDD